MKTVERLQRYRNENHRLRADLAQRSKELAFFINSSKALTSTLEFKKILRVIMERAQRLIKCDAWSLLLLDEELQELRFVAAKGTKAKDFKRFRLKVGQGIAGWVAKTGQPLMIHDVHKDKRFNKALDRITRYKTRSVLCVPIVNKKRTIGVLEMINKINGQPFEEKDRDLLRKLVDQAAIAMERAILYERMSNLAITDDLTKLFNFRYLDQILDREISRCQRYRSVLSLVFFDMDYFKHVNDTHGHLMGSKVLIEVAHLLIENLRTVDIIARYGGDEFVVVLPETDVQTTTRITERLHKRLKAHEFLKEEGLRIQMTASYGIAGYPEHAQTKRDLVHLADQAMYQAKNSGRSRICVAEKPRGGLRSRLIKEAGAVRP
ncbi:MAG: sensor domain-containing diguanylate cyclase [Nitrospirae bacterium]|nr:sensor domain-containing diguanylate cyclase [Nitrospirota bacterium]